MTKFQKEVRLFGDTRIYLERSVRQVRTKEYVEGSLCVENAFDLFSRFDSTPTYGWWRGTVVRACLLYTSDAADE